MAAGERSSATAGGPPPKKRFRDALLTAENEMAAFSNLSSSNRCKEDVAPAVPTLKLLEPPESQGAPTNVSNKAQMMMSKMGFVTGTGLGKYGQGITEPVKQQGIKGRVGLGMYDSSGSKPESTLVWKEGDDPVKIHRSLLWLSGECHLPSLHDMTSKWLKTGPRKETLDDETEFVDEEILRGILSSKSMFDSIPAHLLVDARSRSNPYETIKNGIFMNRAAMKIAEMDAVLEFNLTQADFGRPPFYFADICAGPGGFTEYLLWRRKSPLQVKGFGFTLRGPNDFKIEQITAGCAECFFPFYGPSNDGDIFKEENLTEFRNMVLQETNQSGVHLVTGDGGFSVAGKENIQEVLSKQLYLCQILCGLMVLRDKGYFITKLFDLFTPFSVGLLYLLYGVFDGISLFKPATSRPANSERYVICRGYQHSKGLNVIHYLLEVNRYLNKLKTSNVDVTQIVPLEIMKSDSVFLSYVVESNNTLGKEQIIGLSKIKAFVDDNTLMDLRQSEVRVSCCDYWKLTLDNRKDLPKLAPQHMINSLLGISNPDRLLTLGRNATRESLSKDNAFFPHENKVIVSGGDSRLILLYSRGFGAIFEWIPKSRMWQNFDNQRKKIPIPRDTLLLVELVEEYKPPKYQLKTNTIHIIDSPMIFGENLMNKNLPERVQLLQGMCQCVNISSAPDYMRLRPPHLFRAYEVASQNSALQQRLAMKSAKGFRNLDKEVFMYEDDTFFVPTGMFMFRITKDPWKITVKKSTMQLYYFDMYNKLPSSFQPPVDGMAGFVENHESRCWVTWKRDSNAVLDRSPLDRCELQDVIDDRILSISSK